MDAAEADSIFRLAGETGTPVFEAMHSLHHPLFSRLQSLMRDGSVGDVVRVRAQFDAPIDQSATEFRWRPELGGGALMDLGVYPLAWCRHLFGEAFEVRSASAAIVGVDTSFQAELRFPNGIEAVVSGSLFGERHCATLEIEGSLGRIEVDNFLAPHRGHRLTMRRTGGTHTESVEGPTTYEAQLKAVRNAFVDGAPFPLPSDDYVRSMRAIDKVRSGWSQSG
jgi:predicted dehydrogenase